MKEPFSWLKALVFIVLLSFSVKAVDRSNFKTCAQSGFCNYQRNFKPQSSNYYVVTDSFKKEDSQFSCLLKHRENSDELILKVQHLKSDIFRLKIEELSEAAFRFSIPEGDVVLNNQEATKLTYMIGETALLIYGTEHNKLSIGFNPFVVHFYKNGVPVVVLNGDNLFNFQTHNEAQIAKAAANETGLNWSESFKSHNDPRKHGPSSIGMDITFLNFEHVFGIPEHADSFDLPDTVSRDPYRLYNLDVFAYELHETMALYGSVPVLHAHAANNSVGIFWNNPTETWIDIQSSRSANKGLLSSFFSSSDDRKWTCTHWMSETGIVDLFIMLGPTPQDVSKQYATITGTTPLPPLFALAYHQCRWNYNDQADIAGLDSNFDKYKIPADVLWLDIEHTNGKRYFTWDQGKFSNPGEMVDKLLEKKRRLVTVVDPHIKSDSGWSIYDEGKNQDIYIKDASGNEYSGWCWPGSSAYPDFTSPKTRQWWTKNFLSYEPRRVDTMFSWNDMGS